MLTLREFTAGLWLTELQLEEFDVRGVLLLTAHHAIIWDTLSHPRDMEPLLPLIADKTLTVIYSHADWDHVWGTVGLPAAEIVAHADCLARFSADVPAYLAQKQAAEPSRWESVRLLPPTRTFDKTLTLTFDSLTIELHHLPGHTLDCIVAFLPALGILLAGDTVETPLPVVNDDSPIQPWLVELDRWASDSRVQIVIPAHGRIGGRDIIVQTAQYLRNGLNGTKMDFPEPLGAFYKETHDKNLTLLKTE